MKNTLLILCFAFTLFSFAQENAHRDSIKNETEDSLKYQLEEFTTVGTRTQERIIDVPYSVFSVDKKELSFGKKVSAKDVLADVPGLFLQSRYGNHDIRISIRGFGTRSNSGARGVRILQDGIPESEPDGETTIDAVDFTSLGGVEVVKGNLSSLYANAPGGVINFKSDLYFLHNYASLTNQIGGNGLRQNGFKFGIADKENRLFFSYNKRNMNGYREHNIEGQHLVNTVYEGYLGNGSTISVLGNYVDGQIQFPGSLTKEEIAHNPFQADTLAVSQDFKRVTKKGRIAVRYQKTVREQESGAISEFELTGYGGIKELQKTDNIFFTYATRYSLGTLARFTNRSQIFRRKNIITIGMDFAHQSGPVTSFDNLSGERGISVLDEFNESLSNLGLYGLEKFSIVEEKLDVVISSRFDRNVFSKNIFIPFGLRDTTRAFQKLTPKAGLNFKLSPEVALYTSYGLSYDFPALSELENTPLSSAPMYSLNPDIKAQRSFSFELGMKGNLLNQESEFMRAVIFDITFFNYSIKDEIVPFVINQKTYFRNAGQTERTGIEIGIRTEPFEEIELTTNYTYTHFRYGDYVVTNYTTAGNVAEDYSNNVVPSVPQHILNLILVHEFELSEDFSGILLWDCDYISEMFVNDKNDETSRGYFYGNCMIGINYSYDNFGFVSSFGINNIFDKRYVGFININDYYGRYYETGEPQNIYAGLTLRYKL
jgi:iron complex outermembrane receptor protein